MGKLGILMGGGRPFAGIGLALAAMVALLTLRFLPYSSGIVTGAQPRPLEDRPGPDFTVGPVLFPVQAYAESQDLLPFREEFARICAGRTGLEAAACVTRSLVSQFPNGEPHDEFVAARFDPLVHLRAHMAGQPGHCLTRSAILTTLLLATGIPARIAQLVPPEGSGHTLVEVWDEAQGWILIDPTYAGALGTEKTLVSAASLLKTPERATWYGLSGSPTTLAKNARGLSRDFMAQAFRGHLIYPEPWLYLRTGPRSAPWPFRGRFVRFGPGRADLGPLQAVARVAVVGLGLASLLCAIMRLRSRTRPAIEAASQELPGERLNASLAANP